MAVDVLKENDLYVRELRDSIRDGASGLEHVPALLKCILESDRWQMRKIATGDTVPFERFEDFVTTPPLEGLGTDMGLIRRICGADRTTLNLLDKALMGRQGERTDFVDNINEVEKRPDGTSAEQALRRLRKDRPDLHARVLANELSPHAAMLEAGFRQRMVQVPLDPEGAARCLKRHFQGDQLAALIRALEGEP